ncbi:hypothetical protein HQ576_08290, partial [bacterium]|nr:hypothetical protein [bacterium]
MSLQDVERKVLATAEQEANELLEKATAEAEADLERRTAALRDEQARNIAASKAEADAELERDVSTCRAEYGMNVLQAKNDILDAIFQRALEKVVASDGFDYGAWLARQVRQAVGAGTGVLHCNERDRAAVSSALAEAGTDQVTLSPGHASCQGGVLLVGDSFDLDFTLEALFGDLRQELTVSLAERLFADVPALG